MIKHKFPDAALEATCRKMEQISGFQFVHSEAAEVLADALSAWPGMDVERFMPDSGPYTIHLPLPTEASDE